MVQPPNIVLVYESEPLALLCEIVLPLVSVSVGVADAAFAAINNRPASAADPGISFFTLNVCNLEFLLLCLTAKSETPSCLDPSATRLSANGAVLNLSVGDWKPFGNSFFWLQGCTSTDINVLQRLSTPQRKNGCDFNMHCFHCFNGNQTRWLRRPKKANPPESNALKKSAQALSF
jgi:hypothetical protein